MENSQKFFKKLGETKKINKNNNNFYVKPTYDKINFVF